MVLTFSGTGESLSGILCLLSVTWHQVRKSVWTGRGAGTDSWNDKGNGEFVL